MTFLASACSKTLLKLQKSQIEYQKQIIMFRINTVGKEVDAIEAQYDSDSEGDLEDNLYYQQLRRMSETLETQNSGFEDQISLLDQEINALNTLTTNGIKSSCGLTLSGGS
ncbi:hypothetical protein IKP85_00740 [bacterium]|nr:hypothetical protein [bacterium]